MQSMSKPFVCNYNEEYKQCLCQGVDYGIDNISKELCESGKPCPECKEIFE